MPLGGPPRESSYPQVSSLHSVGGRQQHVIDELETLLKKAFEGKNQGVTLNLTSGVSRQLAERILKGDTRDVFVPSSPAVVDEGLMNKKIAGSGKDAASGMSSFPRMKLSSLPRRGTR